MILTIILLLLGFILLIKGADLFVEGSSSVAKLLRIPSVIIGLTIVAFGTSMPEASVSVTAALSGANELSLSNVLGSNLFNLLVVVGASAMMTPIKVESSVLKKDFPFSIIITLILILMFIPTMYQDSKISVLSRVEGLILLALFIFYLIWTVRNALKSRVAVSGETVNYVVHSPIKTAIFIIGGLAGIIWGGDLVVDSASKIAATFGLSQTLIGLTIVSIGTSLPELVTSVVAAKKAESDIAIGNVVGSNIFNILLVLGASCSLHPVAVNTLSVYDAIILLSASVFVFFLAKSKSTISKKEGFMLLPLYLVFFVYIIIR